MRRLYRILRIAWSIYRWNISPSHREYWGGWIAWQTCWEVGRKIEAVRSES